MKAHRELVGERQITLRALFEVTAACGLFFAVAPYRDLTLMALVLAGLSVWSVRVGHWPLRYSLMVWLSGCGLFCAGLVCLEQAAAGVVLPLRGLDFGYLAFFGTVLATLGAIFGIAGLALTVSLCCAAGRGKGNRAQGAGGRGAVGERPVHDARSSGGRAMADEVFSDADGVHT